MFKEGATEFSYAISNKYLTPHTAEIKPAKHI